MPIAREGHLSLTALLVLALVVGISFDWYLSAPVWAVFLVALFVFRQPAREIEALPLHVLSPVDARVLDVAKARDPFLNRPALRVGLQQRLFGPYIVYAPTEGKFKRVRADKTVALSLRTDENDELTLEVTRGGMLRYLHCNISTGERVRQGGACGFAGFGATFHLYLPPDSRIETEVGGTVRAGQPVAKLPSHTE